MKCCIRGLLNQVDYVSWFTFPMFRSFFIGPRIVRRTHGDTGSDTIAVTTAKNGGRGGGVCFFIKSSVLPITLDALVTEMSDTNKGPRKPSP